MWDWGSREVDLLTLYLYPIYCRPSCYLFSGPSALLPFYPPWFLKHVVVSLVISLYFYNTDVVVLRRFVRPAPARLRVIWPITHPRHNLNSRARKGKLSTSWCLSTQLELRQYRIRPCRAVRLQPSLLNREGKDRRVPRCERETTPKSRKQSQYHHGPSRSSDKYRNGWCSSPKFGGTDPTYRDRGTQEEGAE